MTNYKLIEARIRKNLSQLELAKLVGITVQTMCLIEKGKYNPSLKICKAICKALNKTLDQIFWEEEENE